MSRLRACLAAGLVVAVAVTPASALGRTHRHHAAQLRPRAFGSCTSLVRYARHHFGATHGVAEPQVAPVAEPQAPAPPNAGTSAPGAATPETNGTASTTPYSTTNNQEEGVDEPDIVKTDGSTIFTVANGKLYAVRAAAGGPQLASSIDLGSAGFGAQLLLRGTRLIVISGRTPVSLGVPIPQGGGPVRPAIVSPPYYGAQTIVDEVDVHDPTAMRVTRTVTIDGAFVDARQNGSTARLVISSAPRAVVQPAIRASATGWVPRLQFKSALTGRRHVRPIARCAGIRRPVQFSGLGMVSILTIDLDRGLYAVDSDSLMADAQVVYGSPGSLYVATQRWIDPTTPLQALPATQTTVIDRFDVTDPDTTRLVASGEVPGYLLNQFSLSEYKGFLRVATTSRPIWWEGAASPATSQSYVTVLAERGAALEPVGSVGGLGAGQQIYSVRFLGETGYVVTFRQIDPLYVIDLRTPAAPRVAGRLELEGYSSYLHPVGDGLLLGIGQSVGAGANEPSGTQLELFDVSDPSAPKLLQRTTLGDGSSSEVQYDHHAFLFWPPTSLAVLPLEIYSQQRSGQDFVGAIGYRVDRSGISEVGRVVHDRANGYTPPVRRSVVIGDRLFTISDAGVMSSSLATLARQAFLALP